MSDSVVKIAAGRGYASPRKRTLDLQANLIEYVLLRHGLSGRISDGVVTPEAVLFRLTPELGTRVDKVRTLSRDFALVLGVSEVSVWRSDGSIVIKVSRSFLVSYREFRVLIEPLQMELTELPRIQRSLPDRPSRSGPALLTDQNRGASCAGGEDGFPIYG